MLNTWNSLPTLFQSPVKCELKVTLWHSLQVLSRFKQAVLMNGELDHYPTVKALTFKRSCPVITYLGQIKWLQTRRFRPWVQGWRAGHPFSPHTAAGRDQAWWRIHASAWAWQRKGHLNDAKHWGKTFIRSHFRKLNLLKPDSLYHNCVFVCGIQVVYSDLFVFGGTVLMLYFNKGLTVWL